MTNDNKGSLMPVLALGRQARQCRQSSDPVWNFVFGARNKPVTNENKPVFKLKLKMPFLADGTFRVGPQKSMTNALGRL